MVAMFAISKTANPDSMGISKRAARLNKSSMTVCLVLELEMKT